MRVTKKILSLILAVTIALLSTICAFAADDDATDALFKDFYIISQPYDIKMDYGEVFSFEVIFNSPDPSEIEVPWYDGAVTVDIHYQWYSGYQTPIKGATESVFVLTPESEYYPRYSKYGGQRANFHCEIKAVLKNENGQTALKTFKTDTVEAITNLTTEGMVWNFTVSPFRFAATEAALLFFYAPVLAPLAIAVFVVGIFQGYEEAFNRAFTTKSPILNVPIKE